MFIRYEIKSATLVSEKQNDPQMNNMKLNEIAL